MFTLYTFDLGPCEYIAYFLKREEGRKGKKEESREKEEMGKWKEEGRTEEGRKERQKEREEGKKGEREHLSCSFTLAFFPCSHTAASATMTPEVATPWVWSSCPLLALFGLHTGHCSPLGFSGPSTRQDLPFDFPYSSRDQPIMFKEK